MCLFHCREHCPEWLAQILCSGPADWPGTEVFNQVGQTDRQTDIGGPQFPFTPQCLESNRDHAAALLDG